MKWSLIVVSVGLILTSCCKPAAPLLDVRVNDANGNNLLNGITSNDTIWSILNNPTDTIGDPVMLAGSGNGTVLLFDLWEVQSGVDQYIMVNPQDVDTVNIVFDVRGHCNLRINVDQVTYNGKVFEFNKKDDVVITKF